MKNSLYVIAGFLIILWGIIFWGFNVTGSVHILLVIAAFIVLFRIVFNMPLSNK